MPRLFQRADELNVTMYGFRDYYKHNILNPDNSAVWLEISSMIPTILKLAQQVILPFHSCIAIHIDEDLSILRCRYIVVRLMPALLECEGNRD